MNISRYMAFDIACDVWRRAMNSQLKIWLVLILVLTLKLLFVEGDAPIISKPGCKDICGDVSIPFPFGIGSGCYLDHWFEIECNVSAYTSMAKPLLSKLNSIEVMKVYIGDEFELPSLVVRIPPMNACASGTQPQLHSSINLKGSPYSFSTDNLFMMDGCPGSAVLLNGSVLLNEGKSVVGGCGTVCNDSNNSMPTTNGCYGVHCCQTPLNSDPFNPSFYQINFNFQPSSDSQNCLVATLIKSDSVNQYAGKLSSSNPSSSVPVALSWSWISNLPADNSSHSYCTRDYTTLSCRCDSGYDGNPYVYNGCQVPEDCKGCKGYCDQRLDIPNAYYCRNKPPLGLAAILGLSISFGILLVVIGIYGLFGFIKRRREMKRRAKFFKRNGGLLLQQQLLSNEGILEKTKIFTTSDLEKATDHFNENRILGQGGQGTVYKGMLIDGRIVAIKKAKLLDESQLEQFINEVVILSQINHKNVVKMLGCCLETEVPLLVYEYIPNGTLSQHIHEPEDDFVISWEMCLKIAYDTAAAIAYLHSSSSFPIYHRDIKSSNILLDEKYRAKVSDFGSSKTIAIDQTHLTTLVQGTLGYLDPEYFQSYQFTEKSDVYSFGVVLLEILTGKKPIYRDASTMEQKNLVTEFLLLMQNSGLSNILDPEIVKQSKEEELIIVVELAKCCVSWSGKERPTMKEVVMTVEMIIKSPAQASSWYQQASRFPDEGFAENAINEASDVKFMSSPVPARADSPLYTDLHPLLPDTI